MFGKDEEKPVQTGSVPLTPAPQVAPGRRRAGAQMPPASGSGLCQDGRGRGVEPRSQEFEPALGEPAFRGEARYTLAAAYRMEGALCRDFLASYVSDGSEAWMQGEACRGRQGNGRVRRLKPWRRT